MTGHSVPLIENISVKISGAANVSISDNGRLVYTSGGTMPDEYGLIWVGRDGQEQSIGISTEAYRYPRISPDGRRVALDARGGDNAIWIWDFTQDIRTRLIVDGPAVYPVWAPDGRHLAFTNTESFYWKASNNTGAAVLLAESPGSEGAASPSPYFFTLDGTALVFRDQSALRTGDDLRMMSLTEPATFAWSLTGDFEERNAELSPDGRWMAYQSDESGEFQIYVRPFPHVEDDLVPISNGGGIEPLWSRDGRELFYMQPGSPPQLLSVPIESSNDAFVVGRREIIMDWPYSLNEGEGRSYDVSQDGERFLALVNVGIGDREAAPPQINIVFDWTQELLERVPVP